MPVLPYALRMPENKGAKVNVLPFAKPMKRKRKRAVLPAPLAFPKPAGRQLDPASREWVLTLACLFAGKHVCVSLQGGRAEGHHAGLRPMNRKADDDTMIPLCSQAHRDYEHGSGVFKDMDKYSRRLWAEKAIFETQSKWQTISATGTAGSEVISFGTGFVIA